MGIVGLWGGGFTRGKAKKSDGGYVWGRYRRSVEGEPKFHHKMYVGLKGMSRLSVLWVLGDQVLTLVCLTAATG